MESNKQNDQSEQFVRYFSKFEGNVRAFVASQIHNWDDVDEVVQSSSIVMWRKFDQFDTTGPDKSFLNWAFMIARFEVMKYRTRKARDRLVLSEDVLELVAVEAEEIAAEQSERERALRVCMSKLQPSQKELVTVAYASGISIKEAAGRIGRSPTALYKALVRVRNNLHRCIERTLSEQKLKENL